MTTTERQVCSDNICVKSARTIAALRIVPAAVIVLQFLTLAIAFRSTAFCAPVPHDTSSGWFWQNPLPQGNNLFGIVAFDTLRAIGVGSAGTIIRTTDGGGTWQIQSEVANVGGSLRSVFFPDNVDGWAVGDSGIFLRTIDGGASWLRPFPTSSTFTLQTVRFLDANHGWAVGAGGTILGTADAGISWGAENSGTVTNLTSVFFVTPNVGWSCGDSGRLQRTSNGGHTWGSSLAFTRNDLKDIDFYNSNVGWLAGSGGAVMKTIDNGTTWIGLSTATRASLSAIRFSTSTQGIAVGQKGTVISTSNGGSSWTTTLADTAVGLTALSLTNAFSGWIVGENGRMWQVSPAAVPPGIVLRPQSSGPIVELTDFVLVGTNQLFAVGDRGTLMVSTNGGSTWLAQNSHIRQKLSAVDFWSPSQGAAVGDSGVIATTFDGGNTWFLAGNGGEPVPLRAVKFLDSLDAVAAGDKGTVLKTVDGGYYWQQTAPQFGTSINFASLCVSDSNRLWAVGSDALNAGRIFTSTDQGNSWIETPIQPAPRLNSVFFQRWNEGWAAGDSGKILRTTNMGHTWRLLPSPVTDDFYAVHFVNDSLGWVAGDGGTILRTTDGGFSWARLLSGTDHKLSAVHFLGSSVGWVMGDGGTILKSYDGGGTGIIITPPPVGTVNSIDSLQTYPNPFNPAKGATSFTMRVSNSTVGTITIYDILGRRIREIPFSVNVIPGQPTVKNIGSWDGVEESGKRAPSGMYFYVVQSPLFTVQQKIVLIK
ncbi:MAG: YCF48-related protein [Bacteroidota bacterium]